MMSCGSFSGVWLGMCENSANWVFHSGTESDKGGVRAMQTQSIVHPQIQLEKGKQPRVEQVEIYSYVHGYSRYNMENCVLRPTLDPGTASAFIFVRIAVAHSVP